MGNSKPPASLPDLNLQPQERDLPQTDSKANKVDQGGILLSQPLSQWTLPASLSVLSTVRSVFQVDKFFQGASPHPVSPAPSGNHTSNCPDHFFIYRLAFSSKNKPRTQGYPVANSLKQLCISSLRMIALS